MKAIYLTALFVSCQTPSEWSRAYTIRNLNETIGGDKAIAQPGDFVLENDRIRVAVLGNRPSMGNHTEGGSLVDADLQRANPAYSHGLGNDQMGELFPSINLMKAYIRTDEGEVKIVSDGSGDVPATVCTVGDGLGYITLLEFAKGFLNGDFRIRTDYVLEPGSGAVLVRTLFDPTKSITCDDEMPPATPVTAPTEAVKMIDIITGGGLAFGDFILLGGSIDVFTPSDGFDESGLVQDLMGAGINTFVDPVVADYLGGTSRGVSYVVMPNDGVMSIPMYTSSQTAGIGGYVVADDIEDGQMYVYDRWFAVGQGDMGSALDAALEATGKPTGRVTGTVVERTTGVALSDVNVFAFRPGEDGPWVQWSTDVGADPRPDGSFSGMLPPGQWELMVHAEGRPIGTRVPIKVGENQTVNVVLESPQPGSVEFEVVDTTGYRVPSKVTFFRTDGKNVRYPDLGDGYIGGHPAQVAFATYGSGHVVLPPGRYYAVASRGLEYELGFSPEFEVGQSTHIKLDLMVEHSVDTSGWISADFHVHAVPSPDSGVTLQDRVTTFVAEGVEFLASSDHDAIIDYEPVIEEMGLTQWLSSTPGTEVTTIELGHFLGFPLRWDPLADKGGALDWTDMEPQEIIDGIRDLGAPNIADPVVVVAHPRDGILGYFDQYGFDPFSGTAGNPKAVPDDITELANKLITTSRFTMDFDAMEILNAKRLENIRSATQHELDEIQAAPGTVPTYDLLTRSKTEQAQLLVGEDFLGTEYPGPLDDWFTLLNLGYRITALGNSDTHSKTTTEAGCPRNYVNVGTDDPAEVTPVAVAEAVREGRVVASYGPFIRFGAERWENGPGSTVTTSGDVELFIEVQSPSWFAVDRVELYENGTLIHEWALEDQHDPLIDLATSVVVRPTKDSWYVVIALGNDDLAPVFTPVDIMPVQLQDIVDGAVSEIGALGDFFAGDTETPIPRTFPILPFALTNPIWIDQDGDGFDPPGLPAWLVPPPETTK